VDLTGQLLIETTQTSYDDVSAEVKNEETFANYHVVARGTNGTLSNATYVQVDLLHRMLDFLNPP
jgi:hypothetical protein